MRFAGGIARGLGLVVATVIATARCGHERERPTIIIERNPDHPLRPAEPPPSLVSRAEKRAARADERASRGPSTGRERGFRRVSGPGYHGYVRPAHGPHQWEPGDADIAVLEGHIANAVGRDAMHTVTPDHLTTHARQYRGYVRSGVKFIEVRFFCPESARLARQDVSIAGGGDCLVFTAYDTARAEFLYWRTRARR